MNRLKKFFKNTLALTIAKGLQPLINLALSLAIGRLLGVEILGAYSTIFFILAVFQITSSFGLKTYLTREVSKNVSSFSGYLINGTIVTLPLSLCSVAIMISAIYFARYEDLITIPIIILSVSLPASGIAECFEGILEGLQKIKIIAIAWSIEQITRVLLSIIAIFLGYGIEELCIIYVLARFFYLFLLYFVINKNYKAHIHWQPDLPLIKELFKATKTFGPILILVALYWRVDSILMSKVLGLEEVGIYNASYRLFRFLIIFVQSFSTAFYPMVSSLFEDHSDKFELMCKKAIFYLVIILLPISMTASVFAEEIIALLWGERYHGSAAVLQILIWCIIPYAISKVFAYAMLAGNFQRFDLRINFIGTVLKIGLLVMLMESHSYWGVAVANLLAMILYVFLQLPVIIKHLFKFHIQASFRVGFKVIIATLAMFVSTYLTSKTGFIASAIIANVVYALMLWFNKIFSDDDKLILTKLARLR